MIKLKLFRTCSTLQATDLAQMLQHVIRTGRGDSVVHRVERSVDKRDTLNPKQCRRLVRVMPALSRERKLQPIASGPILGGPNARHAVCFRDDRGVATSYPP